MNSGIDKQNDDIIAYSSHGKRLGQKQVRRTVTIVILAVALVVVLLLLFANYFFKIDTIIVDGTDKYSYSDILKCADLEVGDVIFTVNEKKIEERLKSKFPYIESVELDKTYPGTINITITEEKPLFYLEFENEFYVLTSSLKVLERYTELEALATVYPSLKPIRTTMVYKIIAPREVEFAQEKDHKYISSVLTELSEWKGFENIDSIDISNKFNITVSYDDRIFVNFGNRYDFDTKLNMASAIIGTYSGSATGTVNVKNIEEGIARIEDPEKSGDS